MSRGPKPVPAVDRFWPKVDKDGPVSAHRPDLGPCWLWTASLGTHGYGAFNAGDVVTTAHQFAYEALVGPVPDGLHLDHLCRVAPCCRPSHLEPVTPAENNRRVPKSDTCKHGHPYDGVTNRGGRRCLTCHRESARRRRVAA